MKLGPNLLRTPREGRRVKPSTWAMMIVGFAGLGFLAYRRRQRAAFAATERRLSAGS